MNLLTLPILYPALGSLLANRLQKSLNFQGTILPQQTHLSQLKQSAHIAELSEPPAIPLNRVKLKAQLKYISALALKCSQPQTPLTLAQQIVANLTRLSKLDIANTWCDRVWQNFEVSVIPPGWIYLNLTDLGVAEWLQALIQFSAPPVLHQNQIEKGECDCLAARHSAPAFPAPAFPVLQVHARCCALLKMAAREALLPADLVPEIEFLTGETPCLAKLEPLLWLNSQQQLRCQQPQEWTLILQISDVLDYLDQLPHPPLDPKQIQQTWKVAQRLSRVFQDFDAACRIWGAVKVYDLALAQARLGLVLITQKILRTLLQQLGLSAPVDL